MSVAAGKAATTGDNRSLVHWIVLAGQFGLFLALFHQFNLESAAFQRVALLAFFGWSIHYFLPRRYRLLFFVLLSFVAIEVVFGYRPSDRPWQIWQMWWFGGLVEGLWIVAIGLGLIVICHLPTSIFWRVLLLFAAGGGMAAARVGWISVPWSEAIWPVLASMFMFRLIVYIYAIRHEKEPVTLLERLAYFFMLPNVCFPLFPVVDFQTFRRTYYGHPDRHYIYQTGIQWLFRGTFHLILYRLVYQNFVIDAAEVRDRADLVQFLLWPFLLYLRVSGTFHIITGLLHLFGFNLPETHKLYFLSSSFTDFWRRINIYWKDFIMKIFYYPIYFQLRRWGEATAIVLATLLAFLATWLLHNYQWFWLRGSWIFTWNDFLFWLFLGVLVSGNALHEMWRGRTRRLQGKALTWPETLAIVPRTIGVFAVISVLWSFWSASSIPQWLSVMDAASAPSSSDVGPLFVLVAVAMILAVPTVALARGAVDRTYNFARSAMTVAVPGALALCISFPEVHSPLDTVITGAIASVKNSELNSRDFANFERGYYENLVNVGGFNPELWLTYSANFDNWGGQLRGSLAQVITGRLPEAELRPLAEQIYKGARVRTNQWGMRDQDYEKAHPPNTLRIAFLGASYVFGAGVANEETFEAVLERRLNQEAAGGPYGRYEILNFGVGGYSPLDCLAQLEDKVFQFEPDYIFYFEHAGRAQGEIPDIALAIIQNGAASRYEFLRKVVREAGIDPDGHPDRYLLSRILMPHRDHILQAIYFRFTESARQRGIPIVWIYLPRTTPEEPPELERRLAEEAGFAILDLSGAYHGYPQQDLVVAPWDQHPNALGHRLLANRLYDVLRQVGFPAVPIAKEE